MAKNLIPEIAKMLGVELGEEFKVKGDDELTYRFTNAGLKLTHDSGIELADVSAKVAFADLVNGKDIRVQRMPWADKYGSVDKIPVKEWLDHGWHFTCNICGAMIEDVTNFYINDDGFCCKKCFDEWEEENDS